MTDVIIPDLPSTPESRELAVLRRQTLHFIRENPESVAIHRPGAKTPDGAGGYTQTTPQDLVPQQFRKVIQGGNVASRNIDGETITPAFVFIGAWDADINERDVFKLDGREYKVIFVRDDRRYETWAEVAYVG